MNWSQYSNSSVEPNVNCSQQSTASLEFYRELFTFAHWNPIENLNSIHIWIFGSLWSCFVH